MQFKLSALIATTFASIALVGAMPAGGGGGGKCNTGPIQCCESVQKASDPSASAILGLLGIVLQDLNVLVGLTCTPVTVIGGGGNSCTAQTVCCKNNDFSGLIVIGCTAVNINV